MTTDRAGIAESQSLTELLSPVVRHRNFLDALALLAELIETYPLVFLLGPTGVGKTALAEAIMARFNAAVADDPDLLRAAMVLLRTPRARLYSFKELFRSALHAIQDPLPDRKLARAPSRSDSAPARTRLPGNTSEGELFEMVRDAARDRGLRVLFVDEASALLRYRSPHVLEQTLEVLRDLANGLHFTIVFIATPGLLDHLTSSPEFLRRRSLAYFPHYRVADPADYREYGRVVRTLFDRLPSDIRPKLNRAQQHELMDRTTGRVGETITWLNRAMIRARRAGDDALRWEHFAETALPDKDRDATREQCEQWEEKYHDASCRTFDPSVESPEPAPPPRADTDHVSAAPPVPRSSPDARSKGRIGIPKAKRHKVA